MHELCRIRYISGVSIDADKRKYHRPQRMHHLHPMDGPGMYAEEFPAKEGEHKEDFTFSELLQRISKIFFQEDSDADNRISLEYFSGKEPEKVFSFMIEADIRALVDVYGEDMPDVIIRSPAAGISGNGSLAEKFEFASGNAAFFPEFHFCRVENGLASLGMAGGNGDEANRKIRSFEAENLPFPVKNEYRHGFVPERSLSVRVHEGVFAKHQSTDIFVSA